MFFFNIRKRLNIATLIRLRHSLIQLKNYYEYTFTEQNITLIKNFKYSINPNANMNQQTIINNMNTTLIQNITRT